MLRLISGTLPQKTIPYDEAIAATVVWQWRGDLLLNWRGKWL
ncbi:hypothetical protein [Nostoc flagelliforme]|nr:hypothetical protein [Nostoc flagelliforme]